MSTCSLEPGRDIHASHSRIPVRLRLRKSSPGGFRDRPAGESVVKALQTENTKLKNSIESISTSLSSNATDLNVNAQLALLMIKHRNQIKIKDLQIKTLARKLKLIMAHLPPIQPQLMHETSSLEGSSHKENIHLSEGSSKILPKQQQPTPEDCLREDLTKKGIPSSPNLSQLSEDKTERQILTSVKKLLQNKCPRWMSQYLPQEQNNESIYKTIECLCDELKDKVRQIVEMEVYIEQIKVEISERDKKIQLLRQESKQLSTDTQKALESSAKEIEEWKVKCRNLEEQVRGYESKFESRNYISSSRTRKGNTLSKQAHSEEAYEEGSGENKQSKVLVQPLNLQEPDLDEDSFFTQSDRDVKQMKAIYEAAQKSMEEHEELLQKYSSSQNQLQSLKLIASQFQAETLKIYQFLNISNSGQDGIKLEGLAKLIQQKLKQQQIQANEREEQLLSMIIMELDRFFADSIFQEAQPITINERLHLIKQAFTDQQLACEKLGKENRGELDLSQAKVYLNQLEAVVRRLKAKNQEDKEFYQKESRENSLIQTDLVNQIRTLSNIISLMKETIEMAIQGIKGTEDIDDLDIVVEQLEKCLKDEKWGVLRAAGVEPQGNLAERRQLRSKLVGDLKKRYFPQANEMVDALIDKILLLCALQDQDQVMGCFEEVLYVLKEGDESQHIDRTLKKQIIRERSSYINELCHRASSPDFGEEAEGEGSDERVGQF